MTEEKIQGQSVMMGQVRTAPAVEARKLIGVLREPVGAPEELLLGGVLCECVRIQGGVEPTVRLLQSQDRREVELLGDLMKDVVGDALKGRHCGGCCGLLL